MPSPRWIVAQIGAREHYAVARALHRHGALRALYTDAWCAYGPRLLRRLPEPVRSFANRHHRELAGGPVRAFTGATLLRMLRDRLRPASSDEARYQRYLDAGRAFATAVRDDLAARRDLDGAVYFGYDTGCLETLALLRDRGAYTIVDQIDPGRVEKRIVLDEMARWPGWARTAPVLYDPYDERLAAEWALADCVVVNSAWSKEALVRQGVPAGKVAVVPLAYEAPARPPSHEDPPDSPSTARRSLHVLWLGSVILRKGIQYLIEAAKLLRGRRLTFTVIGGIGLTDTALAEAPDTMTFRGRIPRDAVAQAYRAADVFVLPTLSDGFAITQLEAMAHGVPVVATPNCGRVVTDGHDGHLVPPRDAEALASVLAALDDDRAHLAALAARAPVTARGYTVEALHGHLAALAPRPLSTAS